MKFQWQVTIYAILLFANLWSDPTQSCKWVFPKILACLLTKNESLAGGLIGAGGTIFAGWIAWLAVQQQFRSAKSGKEE